MDALGQIQSTQEFQDTMSFERAKHADKLNHDQQKLNIEREKMNAQLQMKNMDLQIAKENKNKYDVKKDKNKKK